MKRLFIREYRSWSFGINIERLPDGYLFVLQFWKKTYNLLVGKWPDEDVMGLALYIGGKVKKGDKGKLEDYY
jgi:hypothetical protein